MRVIEIEDVFVARIACEGQISARREKMEVLRSGISCQNARGQWLSYYKKEKTRFSFLEIASCSNRYTYWNCFNYKICI